jgi:hypothetical protein
MRRLIIFLLLSVIGRNIIYGQMNMSAGVMSASIPVHDYGDNMSKLSLQLNLTYSSGKGLQVDEVSNFIGTGWDLSGIPVVNRIVKGIPDDQLEKSGTVYDTTKYPPGYLYNNKAIASGCPTALNKYPIFEYQGNAYEDDNSTIADRELDNFQYVLNGKMSTFVIDKNFNAVQLDDSHSKIEFVVQDQTGSNIRTSIKEIHITDENGIKYIFSEQETSRLYKVRENDNGTFQPGKIFSKSFDIPLNQNPYITTSWFVSKIIDTKTNRFISFAYNTTNYRYESRTGLQTEISYCSTAPNCGPYAVTITDPTNNTYTLKFNDTRGVIKKTDIQKKEISAITFPDGSYLSFNYSTDRKDLQGTKMLNNITLNQSSQNPLIKYNLDHSYFIKNEIKLPTTPDEEKWSRLCLTTIRKTNIAEDVSENPWKFDYYVGANATEDFVPPYFFHAKDPWGYYNGSYSGVSTTSFLDDLDQISWTKACIYNQGHGYPGGIEMYYNSKNEYAKNGLMKKIINPYGGITEYEYKQNRYYPALTDQYSFDVTSEGIAVGGVHLSKIIEKAKGSLGEDLITEYDYTDDQGKSTLWGIEPLKFTMAQKSFWQAAGKYFSGSDCKYHYVYPGNKPYCLAPENAFTVFKTIYKMYKQVNRFLKFVRAANHMEIGQNRDYVVNAILQYLITIAISCATDAPLKIQDHDIIYNININQNLLPNQFKKVTEKRYSSTNIQMGKTVYEFTSSDDFPLILPNVAASLENKPRGYYWMYGLPKSVKYYDNSSQLIKSTENEYSDLKNNNVTDNKTLSCNCESYYQTSVREDDWNTATTFNEFTATDINNNGLRLKVDFYNLVTGHSELKKTTDKMFNSSNVNMQSVTNFSYNPFNNLLAVQSSMNSKGNMIETKNYYLDDYNLSIPANAILNQMKNDNILNVPVSTEIWQTKANSTPEMISSSITEFGLAPNGDYKPIKTYGLQSKEPVPQSTIGVFNPSQLIRNSNLIIPQTEVIYNGAGKPVQTNDLQGKRKSSTIFNSGFGYPIASIANAGIDEVAYTSFESVDNAGNYMSWNWTINNAFNVDPACPTGKRCSGGTGMFFTTSVIMNKDYTLSFWAKTDDFSVNNGAFTVKTGPTINGWTYHEYDIPAGSNSPVITGNSYIDELRLIPKNASMTTITYEPGIGKTSECDINNRITYYEYDGLGRISKVFDEHHNIIKTYEYHYKTN